MRILRCQRLRWIMGGRRKRRSQILVLGLVQIKVVPQGSGSSNVRGVQGGERDKGHVNLTQESDAGEIAFCDRCKTDLVRDCRRRAVDNTQEAKVGELHVSEYIAPLCCSGRWTCLLSHSRQAF
jgi:hypothetical protein